MKPHRTKLFSPLLVLLVVFCVGGCANKEADELIGEDIEYYREYFKKYSVSDSLDEKSGLNDDKVKDNQMIEKWKQEYLLLIVEFMSGGFTTSQNLDYLNDNYPQEYYEYCLEDINDDRIPELLLSYKYNGNEQSFWEIYSYNSGHENNYVGTIMYYDRERKILFEGYDGYDLRAYELKNHQLSNIFSYYIDNEECYDDSEDTEEAATTDNYKTRYLYVDNNGEETELSEDEYKEQLSSYFQKNNIKFKGKTLHMDSFANDLGIDFSQVDISERLSDRAYYGLLRYFERNETEMKKFKYSMIEMDYDNIPEMIAVNEDDIRIFYYSNGEVFTLSGKASHTGNRDQCLFFKNKNLFLTYNAYNGEETKRYYAIRNGEVQEILSIEQEPIVTTLGDDYKRDKNGNVMYHYYVDGKVASKTDCESIQNALHDTLGLKESISLSDLEVKSFNEMKSFLWEQSN